ncbi:Arylsulfatase [Rubripirellula lacrimiformis]|uniref:Arylsulfatase n=1 Tax=Rubripirellula lacrimiformis TaxID=1930273 RepID=A0A517NL70_9BACT|nr:arylsulfatase [Rubripirellula lacrimiformis]QDT07880.1 Arylsulfatase [Rubripirellula lacrimiformis]
MIRSTCVPFGFLMLLTAIGPAQVDAAEPSDRPNIIVIVADDMGFSDLGCFGGEIDTPNLDRLAAGGLRMVDFHNNAKCSETRASLLTGLWHQQSRNLSKPGNVTIAEVLRDAGYTTLMSGKWHVAQTPPQRGFDRYFGFLSGAINFYTGVDLRSGENFMRLDDQEYKAPADFYSTDAFTDYAIEFLDQARTKDQPYFLYLAHNAPHYPLQAPPEDIAKYRGKFDAGWDVIRQQRFERMQKMGLIDDSWKLSPRDPKVETFDSLSDAEKKHLLPMIEVYAAMVDRLDKNIGRVIADLEQHDELDNTLILFFSDNGACPYDHDRTPGVAPGPVDSDIAYDARWANMCNTPLRLYKQYAHEGGSATPMIAHWPAKIKAAGSISKYTGHIVDVMPTVVELAATTYPAQAHGSDVLPMQGVSLVPALTGRQSERTDSPIYWEYSGNHAVRDGQWKLVAQRNRDWELYDLSTDRSETTDVSADHPQRVIAMAQAYDQWAQRTGAKTHAKSMKTKPSSQSQLINLSRQVR